MKFSIVINNYNYARYLPQAVESALQQMSADDELIVVDDGSTDNSTEIAGRFESDPRFRLIRQSNAGQYSAVRKGMSLATGDLILLLDSDDYYLPGYLKQLAEIYRTNEHVEFVATIPVIETDSSECAKRTWDIMRKIALDEGIIGPTKWSTAKFFEFVGYPTSGLSMRQSLADKIMQLPVPERTFAPPNSVTGLSPYDPGRHGMQLGMTADGFIVRCASLLNAVKFNNRQPGFYYRIHGQNNFAILNRRDKKRIRNLARKEILRLCDKIIDLPMRAPTGEVYDEVTGRLWPPGKKRRVRFAARYVFIALQSKGSISKKIQTLKAIFSATTHRE